MTLDLLYNISITANRPRSVNVNLILPHPSSQGFTHCTVLIYFMYCHVHHRCHRTELQLPNFAIMTQYRGSTYSYIN